MLGLSLALLLGQVDLVVLAAPFVVALGAALAGSRRRARVTARIRWLANPVTEGQRPVAFINVSSGERSAFVAVAQPTTEGVGGATRRTLALPAGTSRTLAIPFTPEGWGRYPVPPAVVQVVGPGGLRYCEVVCDPLPALRVLPAVEPFRSSTPLPHPVASAGAHRSRVLGPGVEPAGIRAFQCGDRLRRINWRVTQRTGRVHVNATTSDRAGEVVILVDTMYDAEGVPGSPSSLRLAGRAATALAAFRQRGTNLVVIDVLPDRLEAESEGNDPAAVAASRLWRLQPQESLSRLQMAGVPVTRWRGAGSLDAWEVARMANSARLAVR